MIKLIFLIIWIGYSLLEGRRDGYFYHYRNTTLDPKNENIHFIFFIQRAMILFFIFLFFDRNSLIEVIPFMIGLVLIFSFFHNGIYYSTRNKLDSTTYPHGWWSSSISSQATLEFILSTRILFLIIGVAAIISSYFINTL